MSILIQGMEMPQDCRSCVFCENEMFQKYCPLSDNYYDWGESSTGNRPSDCPLVPLPEGHGRLGDLDKIKASLGAMMEIEDNHNDAPYSWAHAYTEMKSILDDAPTIVPAEGGTDECSEN